MGLVRVLRQETQRILSPSWRHVMTLFCNLEEGSRQNLIVKIIILAPLTQTFSLLIWENSISTVFREAWMYYEHLPGRFSWGICEAYQAVIHAAVPSVLWSFFLPGEFLTSFSLITSGQVTRFSSTSCWSIFTVFTELDKNCLPIWMFPLSCDLGGGRI